MLMKLMKYELKATARIFLPLYGALAILAILNRVFFFADTFESNFLPVQTVSILSMVAYSMLIAAIFVLTLVIAVQRFYRNLLGDEGYLMFTLPVKPWKHIVSKSVISIFWFGVSTVVTILSAFLIMMDGRILGEMMRDMIEAFAIITARAGIHGWLLILELLILMLVGFFAGILEIYAAICIGQFWSRHKVLGAFGAFIGINFVLQMVTTMGSWGLFRIFDNMHFSGFMFNEQNVYAWAHGSMWVGVLVCAAVAAVFFFVSNYVLSKKLNLE